MFVEEHRLGNDAAVAEPFRGGNFERTADPLYERRRFLGGERTLLQTIAQGAAVHASHDQVRTRRFAPVVVDRNDRIVGDRRNSLRVRLEVADEVGLLSDVVAIHTDRQFSFHTRESRRVHDALATDPEPIPEPVPAQRPAGRFGEEQGRVVFENPPFELDEGRRRVESELFGEDGSVLLVRAQRIRLSAHAIEREHETLAESVTKRMLHDQLLELGHNLGRAPARKLGVDESLVRDETELVESLCLDSNPVLIRELRVGLAVPHGECGAQLRRGRHGVIAVQAARPVASIVSNRPTSKYSSVTFSM